MHPKVFSASLAGLLVCTAVLTAAPLDTRMGTIMQVLNDTIMVTEAPGQQVKSYKAEPTCTIMRNGKPAKLTDLHAGDQVQLTLVTGSASAVSKIEAQGGPVQ